MRPVLDRIAENEEGRVGGTGPRGAISIRAPLIPALLRKLLLGHALPKVTVVATKTKEA